MQFFHKLSFFITINRNVLTLFFVVIIYLMGTLLLLLHLGSHPPFPYNWEPYTILYFLDFWHSPTLNIFHLTDSVMTDSGKSPIGVLPIWLFFKIYGLGLTQLRLPFAL